MYPQLFSPYSIKGVELQNRLTMAPLYLGYAAEGSAVSPLLLDHYRLMAQSGVALEGLATLARIIKQEGARADLQINHAGRFAGAAAQPVAPSAVDTFGRQSRALSQEEVPEIVHQYANAARRVKQAGFDLVELHSGTGYLLAQFVSHRTNRRDEDYGGPLENRQKFPL